MKNSVNKEHFELLIEKYVNNTISLEEIKLLINYYESFQENKEWLAELGTENKVKDQILATILAVLEKEEKKTKIIPLYRKAVFKYAAVAALVVFFTAVYFNFSKNKDFHSQTQVVSAFPIIKPGTDKAFLTTENGTTISLGNNNNFKSINFSTTAKELVYHQNVNINSESYNYLTVPRGGQYAVTLSDGTQVWLNSESKIKYPVAFSTGKVRTVELMYGEAYFQVSPSSKHKGVHFKVYHNGQEIEVLGTEFNVKAYKDEKQVYTTLVKGKVAISFEGKKENLIPNQQSQLDLVTKSLTIATIDVSNEISWKEGNFVFEGKSLKEIMKVLSRWYNVEVVFQNKKLEETKFVGVLGREQNLGDILSSIKDLGFIKGFEIKDKQVQLN
ncbi:MAG: FecR domain-containing protein [Flavobacterium sp.]